MEQSPSDETAISQLVPPSQRHGTIVGEGLASAPLCMTTSSTTMVQPPPPAVLSFRDQTICPTESSIPRTTAPGWNVYTSPKPESSVGPRSEPFTIMEDLDKPPSPDRVQKQVSDVPMSPECALKEDWLAIGGPEVPDEPDLDAFLSPCRLKTVDVPMSPEQPQPCADVPMSPVQQPRFSTTDDAMMSPDRRPSLSADVSMNAATPGRMAGVQPVTDPWDDELISDLLSTLTPPLTSHPHCITWQCNIPAINPKMTIRMGTTHLHIYYSLKGTVQLF